MTDQPKHAEQAHRETLVEAPTSSAEATHDTLASELTDHASQPYRRTFAESLNSLLLATDGGEHPTFVPPSSTRKQRGELHRTRFAGRFQITRLLGQGGMGAVYLAKDTVIGRDVAIKTLRTDHLEVRQRKQWLQTALSIKPEKEGNIRLA